ncbi:MAG: PSD1 and planctomycete cytochrome C domain-containing protein [Planctomycetia bacterium]|nr:PSD1 and planctomycete cytochrome C domain-containing protein [Planctomycetia bacterium]
MLHTKPKLKSGTEAQLPRLRFGLVTILLGGLFLASNACAESPRIPPAATRQVDFHREVLPLLARHCARCHSSGKHEGELAIDSRQKLLAGGGSGPAVVVGHSDKSLLIELVSGGDPDRIMPSEGRRLTAEEIGILRAWIDQGVVWENGLALSAYPTARWEPRSVELPPAAAAAPVTDNPLDRLLPPYLAKQGVKVDGVVSNRVYARRVYEDLVGLPPRAADIEALEKDTRPDKRTLLVRRLLDNGQQNARQQYAIHWLTFWNDALRNDNRGPGYIDGGRKQISVWLRQSLEQNKPYDQFVRELIAPSPASEGFVKGIVWRGVVNASQKPEMQAAQNVSQVFLGINLKCASCHDSFVSEWKLDDAYGLAGVFANAPPEVHRCDSPVNRVIEPRFLYSKLGKVDPKAPLAERRKQLAAALTSKEDGRLARTIVNRLWARLLGRGLIEPVDAMDNPPWNADILDYLATDLVEHGYDLKHTLELIATSRAYQLPSVGAPSATEKDYVFRGPLVKRLAAEQFIDAVSAAILWKTDPPNATAGQSGASAGSPNGASSNSVETSPDFSKVGPRAALADADNLARALGRPSREQVVTSREPAATTLQVLELTNGTTLDNLLKRGAEQLVPKPAAVTDQTAVNQLIEQIYLRTLARRPLPNEIEIARGLTGTPATREGVQDLVWSLIMLPEFQLVQ